MNITFVVVTFVVCLIIILFALYFKFTNLSFKDFSRQLSKEGINQALSGTKVEKVLEATSTTALDKLFQESRNPWKISKTMFQGIRFGGLIVGLVVAIPLLTVDFTYAIIPLLMGYIAYWYPNRYYADEAKHNKEIWYEMYSYMWVVSQNLTQYGAETTCYNTASFLNENTNETELADAFQEFGDKWSSIDIPAEIQEKYFCFEIPKQIIKLMFNAEKLGQLDEEDFDSVETYISQEKDQQVENVIAKVASKAVLSSTPFVFLSIIAGVIAPVVYMIFISL